MESTKFIDIKGKEWASEREFILWLFNGRCVSCKKVGKEVNHIIPKGRGGEYYGWRNQVPQCSHCHYVHHHDGTTNDKIWKLQEKRREFLVALGRSEFI